MLTDSVKSHLYATEKHIDISSITFVTCALEPCISWLLQETDGGIIDCIQEIVNAS